MVMEYLRKIKRKHFLKKCKINTEYAETDGIHIIVRLVYNGEVVETYNWYWDVEEKTPVQIKEHVLKRLYEVKNGFETSKRFIW